jgi:hypothetical protein
MYATHHSKTNITTRSGSGFKNFISKKATWNHFGCLLLYILLPEVVPVLYFEESHMEPLGVFILYILRILPEVVPVFEKLYFEESHMEPLGVFIIIFITTRSGSGF